MDVFFLLFAIEIIGLMIMMWASDWERAKHRIDRSC